MEEKSTLIRKVHMNCPICDKIHEVEENDFQQLLLKEKRLTTKNCFIFVQMLTKMRMNLRRVL